MEPERFSDLPKEYQEALKCEASICFAERVKGANLSVAERATFDWKMLRFKLCWHKEGHNVTMKNEADRRDAQGLLESLKKLAEVILDIDQNRVGANQSMAEYMAE